MKCTVEIMVPQKRYVQTTQLQVRGIITIRRALRGVGGAWLLCALITSCMVQVAQAQFLAVPGGAWVTLYSWGGTTSKEDTTIALPWDMPPAAVPRVKPWRVNFPSAVSGFKMNGPSFTAWEPFDLYDTFSLWLQGDTSSINLQFDNDKGTSLLLDRKITDLTSNNVPLQSDVWTKIVINMKEFQITGLNTIQIVKTDEKAGEIRLAGFFGWEDGEDRTKNPVELPLPNNVGYKFATVNQSGSGDRGLVCSWHCTYSPLPLRPSPDLADVPIYAFRDTTSGPMPMQGLTESITLSNGIYNFQWIWDKSHIAKRLVSDYPSPYYACTCAEADYFEIGNTTTATYTLVAWVPYTSESGDQLVDFFTSYAQWVKLSCAAGQNVAVIVRNRVPNEPPFNGTQGWGWVQNVAPDCNRTDLKGLCPDHIWFRDSQIGALHLDQSKLAPMTELNRQYFKKTGFDISFDMLPAIDKLLYYSGDYYGIPVQVEHPDWHIHYDSVHYLWSIGMKAPPPIDEWTGSWWDSWNMMEFNKIVKALSDGGYTNIVPLPAGKGMTPFFQYIVAGWGATMLDGKGRCGLDESAERAINETFVEWLSYGALQPHVPPISDPSVNATWEKWKTALPLEKPWEETIFSMNDMRPEERYGLPLSDSTKQHMGFGLETAWGANNTGNVRFIKMYPPTGIAQINGIFVGIAVTSRNQTIAHDALMGALARNRRLHANTALRYDRIWGQKAGVSGYISAFHLPDYVMATKPSYARMLSDEQILKRAMFAGYPVQQYPSSGLIAPYDPMNLMINEIHYKNMSTKEAIKRACLTINWITMPPCGPENWEAYLVDDKSSNKASVYYRWKANKDQMCREDVSHAKALPDPVIAAAPLTYTSTRSSTAVAMVVVSGIGILFELVLMALFVWYRSAPVVRAASRIPSMLIFVGAICTLASVIMRVTSGDQPGWLQCYGTYWFFATGFGLVLGSLAMKSYRIYTIFRAKTSVRFSDFKLIGLILFLVFGEFCFCFIYQFWLSEPTGIKVAHLPGLRFRLEQQDCPITHQGAIIMLYLYNALLIVLAAAFAFKTRKTVSAFNESTFTAAAIALICIITVIIVPVLSMISSPQAIFMLIALGTFIATVLSTAVFAIPKILIASGFWEMADVSQPSMRASVTAKMSTVKSGERTRSSEARSSIVKSKALGV